VIKKINNQNPIVTMVRNAIKPRYWSNWNIVNCLLVQI
jgi:hypothetical protein